MIADHLEPKGLDRHTKYVGDFMAAAMHRENAERGSRMLRDAILLAKGIAPPAVKEEPRQFPATQAEAHRPHLCPLCSAPFKPQHQFVAHIQETVAAYYGIHPRSMTSQERRQKISHPRQVAIYLALELTGKPYSEIGRRFGGRDHTTVIYARRAVEQRMYADAEVLMDVETLRERLAA